MSADDPMDRALRALGEVPLAPPPLSADLEAELADLKPAVPRSPRRGFVLVGLGSILYIGALLGLMKPSATLAHRPWLGLVLYGAAWLAGFLVIGWVTLVPGPGQVMPRWRLAGLAALAACVGFVLAGLLLGHDSGQPGGTRCLFMGTATAVVPVFLGALVLRGRLPVGSRWAGAGLGAAGGALSGLFLHLHCPVITSVHLGFVHGGVIVLCAAAGALLMPRRW